MRVRDIMTSPVHTVRQNASVESAAELMTARSVTALPVVDADGALVGMVSEGDLLRHQVPADPATGAETVPALDPVDRQTMVVQVMSAYPLATTPRTDVAEVAEVMLQNDVRSLPVLDARTVVGIISRRDILRALVRSDGLLTREVQHRLDEYADGRRRWTATVEGGVATVAGDFDDETERTVVTVLTRTVAGVSAVKLAAPAAS
ncbi:HPP family protein [Actinoplanes sp. NPDC049599]|uniref:HPP family protein n=1 Tax=Actinoplanes sp. NPDC049599 TaxID=3363903 RepID=UPI0037AB1B85